MADPQPMSHPASTPALPPSKSLSLIEVTGEGRVTATPNRAIILLGAITENPSLSTAQSENATATTSIINALLRLQIPRERIQTETYRIEPQYNYEDGKQLLVGYRVTHLLQITVDRVELTGQLVDTAVHHGANHVSSIQFTLTTPDFYYNQALSIAVQNAQIKAATIARASGVTLIRTPISITEETYTTVPPIPFKAYLALESAAAPTPIQPGELEIRAALKAQYTFV